MWDWDSKVCVSFELIHRWKCEGRKRFKKAEKARNFREFHPLIKFKVKTTWKFWRKKKNSEKNILHKFCGVVIKQILIIILAWNLESRMIFLRVGRTKKIFEYEFKSIFVFKFKSKFRPDVPSKIFSSPVSKDTRKIRILDKYIGEDMIGFEILNLGVKKNKSYQESEGLGLRNVCFVEEGIFSKEIEWEN